MVEKKECFDQAVKKEYSEIQSLNSELKDKVENFLNLLDIKSGNSPEDQNKLDIAQIIKLKDELQKINNKIKEKVVNNEIPINEEAKKGSNSSMKKTEDIKKEKNEK